LAFECRFLPSGDQDLLIVRIDGRNLEIRRAASGDRIAFVRLDGDPRPEMDSVETLPYHPAE